MPVACERALFERCLSVSFSFSVVPPHKKISNEHKNKYVGVSEQNTKCLYSVPCSHVVPADEKREQQQRRLKLRTKKN